MKAVIPRAIVGFVIAIVFVLIVATTIVTLPEVFAKGTAEELLKFRPIKSYSFDLNDFLVDPADPKAFDLNKQNVFFGIGTVDDDPAFCKNLRSCIDMNVKGGKQCLISYKVKPGTNFNPNIIWDSIRNRCPQTDIKEELYSRTGRKVCKFIPNSLLANNSFREDNISLIEYEPEIHNCFIPDNLGGLNVLNEVNSFNYLYSGRGSVNGYSFENGGTVRIVVTNVSINADPYATCSYSLYVCGQNAIANTTDETPVKIFRIIQNLNEKELYYNETIVWGGPNEVNKVDVTCYVVCYALLGPLFPLCSFVCGAVPPVIQGYNVYGYNPHPYEFTFNGNCQSRGTCDKALTDAVDAGMWEWNKANYDNKKKMKYFLDAYYSDINYIYFSYSPFDSINVDPNIKFNSECWNTSYENSNAYDRTTLSFGNNVFTDSTSLHHNFNFSNGFNVNNKISMNLGIKKIFITYKEYHFVDALGIDHGSSSILEQLKSKLNPTKDDLKPRVILVLDPITFCSEQGESACINQGHYCCGNGGCRGTHYSGLDSECSVGELCCEFSCCPDLNPGETCPVTCQDLCWCPSEGNNKPPGGTCI